MTNAIITSALENATSANNQALTEIVMGGGPVWPQLVFAAWALLVILSPLLSIYLCIRAWRRRRQKQASPWTIRTILTFALLIFTTNGVYVCNEISSAIYVTATNTLGTAERAMLSMAICRDCNGLLASFVAIACCLLCACWLPLTDSREKNANQASHATSELAPGAASSSHEG